MPTSRSSRTPHSKPASQSRFPNARPSPRSRSSLGTTTRRSSGRLCRHATSHWSTLVHDVYISRDDGPPRRSKGRHRRRLDPGRIVGLVELSESLLDQRTAATAAVVRALPLASPRTTPAAVPDAAAGSRATAASRDRPYPPRLHSSLRDVRYFLVRSRDAGECFPCAIPLAACSSRLVARVIKQDLPKQSDADHFPSRRPSCCSSPISYSSAPTLHPPIRRRSGQTALPMSRSNALAIASRPRSIATAAARLSDVRAFPSLD